MNRPLAGGDVAVRGLWKSYGSQPVLRGVDLAVPAGAFATILGPSGSGKTTLLRIVAGFDRADAGTVAVGERVLDDGRRTVPPERRGIGYVAQEGSLFPHLTVERNVAFGLPRGARRSARVADLLAMVGLEGMGRRYPHQLSGGQQQRVALARALATEPKVVLLDEPFSSLDAGLRASVRHDVRRVLREAGATVLMVTHDQDEALSVSDMVAVMRRGEISQTASPETLYRRPADPELASFVGDANLVAGRVEGKAVRTALGRHPLVEGSEVGGEGAPVVVLVRPEQLELVADPAAHLCAGRVLEVEYYGHDTVVRVALGEDPGATLVARSAGGATLARGARVGLMARGAVNAWPAGETDPGGPDGPEPDGPEPDGPAGEPLSPDGGPPKITST